MAGERARSLWFSRVPANDGDDRIRLDFNGEMRMAGILDASLLLVDDDPSAILVMSRILGEFANQRFATSAEVALRLAEETPPDLILLDSEMPGMGGFGLCAALKAKPDLADIPVIFVTSHKEASIEIAGFALGAVDFITKPIVAPLVLARVKAQLAIKSAIDQLRGFSIIDALTNVANRRHFDVALEREWRRAWRGGGPLALLLIDVDHFKLYNDTHGHQAGDVCLQAIAAALKTCAMRPSDVVARYGGEEFALILPQTLSRGAASIAQQVIAAVDMLALPHSASPTAANVTVSIGVATYDDIVIGWSPATDAQAGVDLEPQTTAADLLFAADKALYRAKHSGRAQVQMSDVGDVIHRPYGLAATPTVQAWSLQ